MHETHNIMWAARSILCGAKPRLVGLWSRRRLSPTLSGETQLKLDFLTDKGQELRNAGAAGTGARAPERCHGSGNASSEYSEYAGNFPFRDDQAVALRRRRLSDPVAALAIPSNTLACLNALAEDAKRRHVLGPRVDIRLHTFDETNRRVKPNQIIRMIRRAGGRALIGLVGVQSNQFPRAVDLAKPFLDARLPVCIGGFHISGCIAMLPELPRDIKAAQDLGISFFAGEAEERRLDQVLRDAWNGERAPLYNYMDNLPALAGEPPPFLPRQHVSRTSGSLSSIDLGRGCPYQCSFCTIINVQGRKSRIRSADDLEHIVRENYAEGIKRFFITDDNFARNKDWEPLFDRMIQM